MNPIGRVLELMFPLCDETRATGAPAGDGALRFVNPDSESGTTLKLRIEPPEPADESGTTGKRQDESTVETAVAGRALGANG